MNLQNLNIGGTDRETLSAVLAAVNMVGIEEPVVKPAGALGGCVACGHTVASHFQDGRFVGCLKGTVDTVFILVPATVKKAGKAADLRGSTVAPVAAQSNELAVASPEPAVVARGFVRARYVSTLHHLAKPEKLGLSPTRTKVLKAIHETGKAGILARGIRKRTKLPHGSVQQTLNWLRAHQQVVAREDAAPHQ